MPRRPKFNERKTADGWCVNVPASFTATGKREQHFFPTRDKARDYGATLREKLLERGTQASAIKPSLAEDATTAAEILAPWGLSLAEAARMVAALREKETASKPFIEAADLWLVDCEGLRPKTLAGYRHTVQRMKGELGERLLATLTGEELQAAIIKPGTPPTAAAGHLRNARALWRWCAGKGWCDAETVAAVSLPKASRSDKEIAILKPDEAEHLLRVAETHFPAAVASYALQLFAGIRAEEITRLEVHHVSAEGIELAASVTKKGRRRHITPNATLAAWLAAHPFAPCPNWRRVDRSCRYLAGWNLAPDPDLVPAAMIDKSGSTRPDWPQNALRHSHASYAVATGTPLETLLFEFGHAGSPTVLREHYVGRASKKDALRFFDIMPKGTKAKPKLRTVKSA